MTVDLDKVRKNITRIADKFKRHGLSFRPHFKTHQCAAIGDLFREVGVSAITVSSLDMASYFQKNGWNDITLAVPVNLGQLQEINRLAGQIKLNLLVDSLESTRQLNDALDVVCPVWVKVDVGYGRVGIKWDKEQEIIDLIQFIDQAPQLELCGLLTHSGHTYECRGQEEVVERFEEGRLRMVKLKQVLQGHGFEVKVSMGDTPSASLSEQFEGVDEMRPGNFVFYDLCQSEIGSCGVEDIAVATACPVIGKYEEDQKLVVYGGSVHLSKDSIHINGERLFGQLALPDGKGWKIVALEDGKVTSCCQEVSKIQVSAEVFEQIELGQNVYILPVHSCLAADLYPRYITLKGDLLERFRLLK